jgi:cytochrome c peroxidase
MLRDNAGLQDFAAAHGLVTSFDATAAQRGEALFNGKAGCDACHNGPKFTDANKTLHDPDASVSADTDYVQRSASKMWRTTPLLGLWAHPPYFHDGSAATLADVVGRYNDKLNLELTLAEQNDLAEYLKSL